MRPQSYLTTGRLWWVKPSTRRIAAAWDRAEALQIGLLAAGILASGWVTLFLLLGAC